MSKILVIGNILKDVYVRLDSRKEKFETDENGTKWLNLSFDGSSHKFFDQVSVFGGATTTLEVLNNFGVEAEIASNTKKVADNYRYILCTDDEITYFVPSERKTINFIEPEKEVDWVFVDRSATVNEELAKQIVDFIKNKEVKLALHAHKDLSHADRILAEVANFLFIESDLQGFLPRGKICMISKNEISLDGEKVFFNVSRADLMTHLTINSIIAASIFGASLRNEPVHDSLLFAKENIENASLTGTMSFEKLKDLVETKKREDVNLKIMAKSLVAASKGILAADESGGSIHKKFENMKILDDAQNRRDYRNIFFTTRDLEKYVNGVILFDETTKQKTDDGQNFVDFLTAKGIIPGIKVDLGLENIPGSEEKYTKGLEDLDERLADYHDMGLRFAKWRAAFEISKNTPSDNAIEKNCEILAEYARKCQAAKIVPIVEPEVVYDGEYSIKKSAEVTGKILDELFVKLTEKNVDLEGTILKVNMVLAGKKFTTQSTPKEVGEETAKVLKEHVPKNLAGVVFLSGGQDIEQATKNLQAVTNNGPFPWPVTFSFARALQDPALEAWRGDNKNCDKAREKFLERLVKNSEALKKN